MRSSLADLLPPAVPPEEARRAAREILARPEYREPEPSLVARVVEAIGDFLASTFDRLAGSGPGGVVGIAVTAALTVAAIALVVRAWRAGWSPRRRSRAPDAPSSTVHADDPGAWLAETRRLAASGDLRGALRSRHRALVATLDRRGVVAPVPGRTPAELRDEVVAKAPSVAGPFGSLTASFERVVYGGAVAQRSDLEAFARHAEAVESAPVTRTEPELSP